MLRKIMSSQNCCIAAGSGRSLPQLLLRFQRQCARNPDSVPDLAQFRPNCAAALPGVTRERIVAVKIAILGLGHVALADALALGRRHAVRLTGPVPDRIDAINTRQFALNDPALQGYLAQHRPDLAADTDTEAVLQGAEMVFISMPLSVDPATGTIATAEIESRIARAVAQCPGVPVVIRSAVPLGFCARMIEDIPGAPLVLAPEFLSAQALGDLLDLRDVVVGHTGALGARVGRVLASASMRADVRIHQMPLPEAEAVMQFSHALMANRMACLAQIQRFAARQGLDAQQIIDGVCLDPRLRLDAAALQADPAIPGFAATRVQMAPALSFAGAMQA